MITRESGRGKEGNVIGISYLTGFDARGDLRGTTPRIHEVARAVAGDRSRRPHHAPARRKGRPWVGPSIVSRLWVSPRPCARLGTPVRRKSGGVGRDGQHFFARCPAPREARRLGGAGKGSRTSARLEVDGHSCARVRLWVASRSDPRVTSRHRARGLGAPRTPRCTDETASTPRRASRAPPPPSDPP